ncbi:hypothetical protein TRVA0_018S02586 [Trichomonascus vanleenenianus]|uniref:palmitoyltransferase PFA5 n=1 Tax=Trichomonascus vanleenenianus TaxID=2268995 RepID=UPI003ECB0916
MINVIGHLERLLPAVILVFIAFIVYAYCYNYAWQEVAVSQARGGGMTALLDTIFAFFVLIALTCWIQVLRVGPGHADAVPVEEASDPERMPNTFLCDPQGFRQYCSSCQKIKPDRAHHSSQLERCVPKMDHYCAWLSSTIGRANHKLFLQFLFYAYMVLGYIIITLPIFAHSHRTITGQIVALYAVTGVWFILLSAFLFVTLRLVLRNLTTIENLNPGRDSLPIYNIAMEDGTRAVIRLRVEDVKKNGPYDNGKWNNWRQMMGPNLAYWILPIPFTRSKDVFNENLLNELRRRFKANEDGYYSMAAAGRHRPESASSVEMKTMTTGPTNHTDD